jgi:cathepsin B
MSRIAFALLLSLLGLCALVAAHEPVVTQDLVDEVNSRATTWQAHMNPGSMVDGATREQIMALCGAMLTGGPQLPVKPDAQITSSLPQTFDARQKWPHCKSLHSIRDQSACGSCWAFAAVEAMSDRSCIFLNKNLTLSSADMAFCCESCGDGCNGGFPAAAWQYYESTGVVEEACDPYPFPSCDHHIPGSKNPCPEREYQTPPCAGKCVGKDWSGQPWPKDLHYGKSAYSVHGITNIMEELVNNGPVEAAMEVYADFLTYKSGVYQHTSGSFLGGHAIKILGYGVENGTPYWLCANSWNPTWGDKGYFKILKGQDEVGIESGIVAGIPSS